MKLMAKDPAERYQNALEVAAALRPFAERQPIKFDFRELITLRSKLAEARAASAPGKAAARGPPSPIPTTGSAPTAHCPKAQITSPSTIHAKSQPSQ
ncbi:MAG UNVERIFIED_CONTAM: hypothetical protein LVR18_28245 [Planctomycetaceae bacterium]